jgi:hypothetical protein
MAMQFSTPRFTHIKRGRSFGLGAKALVRPKVLRSVDGDAIFHTTIHSCQCFVQVIRINRFIGRQEMHTITTLG